jgi:DNA-binding transcriptional regulator GbsR (MarR family)
MTDREIYIEKAGQFYVNFGLPRMSGRILGVLLSSDKEENSFSEIQNILKASKGSISESLNLLERVDYIEKFFITGKRKAFYRAKFEKGSNIIDKEVELLDALANLYSEALSFNKNKDSNQLLKSKETIKFLNFMSSEIKLLINKWESQNEV